MRASRLRRADVGDRAGDPDATLRLFGDAQQQRRHIECRALSVGQLGWRRHRDIVGHRIHGFADRPLAFGRDEDGIQAPDHAALARSRQIEVALGLSLQKCGDAVCLLPPQAQEGIVVTVERVHGGAFGQPDLGGIACAQGPRRFGHLVDCRQLGQWPGTMTVRRTVALLHRAGLAFRRLLARCAKPCRR